MIYSVFSLPTPFTFNTRALQVREDPSSSALPEPAYETQKSCYTTCGKVCYQQTTIDDAVSDGYSRYKSGDTQDDYPHTYNDYEGFKFPVDGPYQEYPVLSSFKAYNGSSPGADRVIFNEKGKYAGTITHTGASGNDFVACT